MKRLLKVISIVNYNTFREIGQFMDSVVKKFRRFLTLSIHRAIFRPLGNSGSAALLDCEPLIGKGDNPMRGCLESVAGKVNLPI